MTCYVFFSTCTLYFIYIFKKYIRQFPQLELQTNSKAENYILSLVIRALHDQKYRIQNGTGTAIIDACSYEGVNNIVKTILKPGLLILHL